MRLEIPSGSITETIEVSIESAQPPGDAGSVVPGTVYEFEPEGITFDPPLRVEIAYDEAALPAGVDESTLAIHVWEGGEWVVERDAAVDTVNNVLSASLVHFSARAARVVGGDVGPDPDAGGEPDSGAPDSGAPDAGEPDAGGTDGGTDSGTDAGPDADGDGVPDSEDNCPDLPNADQADADADGAGDACARGIFVELVWDDSLNDLNLFYLHEDATSWTDPMWALYWSRPMASWEGAQGDPSYPIDETRGPGPESVIHREAGSRVHYVGVDNSNSNGSPPATATVRVYLRGERAPTFEASKTLSEGDFWAVARIEPGPGEVVALTDQDDDGVPAEWDNCPITPNFDQADGDGDGVGDACAGVETCQTASDCTVQSVCLSNRCAPDGDGDGTPDASDTCPARSNPAQLDTDSDGLGDACDGCPDDANPGQENGDMDSHPDACDNCPLTDNEDQADADGDGLGDACD